MYADGEKPDILKLSILENIKSSRALFRNWVELARDYPEHASQYLEFASHEQMLIEQNVKELIELKRRRAKQAIYREQKIREQQVELELRSKRD